MNNHKIETERLLLRAVLKEDLKSIHLLHSLAEVDQYNTLGIPANLEETSLILDNWLEEPTAEKTKRFTFVIQLKKEKQFIGLIAINLGKANTKMLKFGLN